MRKSTMLLFFALLSGAISCQRSEVNSVVPGAGSSVELPAGVSKVNTWLAFNDRTAYEGFISQLNKKPEGITEADYLNRVEQQLDFASMRKTALSQPNARAASNNPCVEDEHLATLLDPNGIVQIQDWLIKLNLCQKRCYVLPKKETTDALLTEFRKAEPRHEKIRVFSTDDDVLDLLAGGQTGRSSARVAIFCSESGAPATEMKGFNVHPDGGLRMDNKVVYQAAAIYFSLQAKSHIEAKDFIWQPANLPGFSQELEFDYNYKPKCRNQVAAQGTDVSSGTNTQNKRVYEASRGLNRYYYRVIFRLTSPASRWSSPAYQIQG